MRPLTGLTIIAAGMAAGAALWSLKNNPSSNFKDADFKEVITKMSQAAGPVLKHTLPLFAAFIVTGCAAAFSTITLGLIVYPHKKEKNQLVVAKDKYQEFSTLQKIRNFTVLTLAGTTVGAALGGIMMKAATVFFQLSPRYFKNSTIALTALGAGIGALVSRVRHLEGTKENINRKV